MFDFFNRLPFRKCENTWSEPFIPGWMPDNHCRKIFDLLVENKVSRAIEIGTFMGRSAHVFASAFRRLGGKRKLVCVDTFEWVYDEKTRLDKGILMLRENYPEAARLYFDQHGIRTMRDGFNLTLKRFPFMKDYLDVRQINSRLLNLEGQSFDFALLDAGHSYEEVKSDFEKVRPCLGPGSILCLDDNTDTFPGVQKMVRELKQHPDLEAFETFQKFQFFRVLPSIPVSQVGQAKVLADT